MSQSTRLTPVKKPETILELGAVDIAPLKQMIARISNRVWDIEDSHKENKYFCFHHTRHMVFRFIEGNRDPRHSYDNPSWRVWKPILQPLFDKIGAAYPFQHPQYPKAMLARLEAGHIIDSHYDGEGSHQYTHKIHVPIQTNPGALFIVDDQPFHLREGVGYEVNNIAKHGVENRGDSDRIHLIFEIFEVPTDR